MIGKRVQVYFNLHKKVYSVRCKKTRLVIAHVNNICLEDVNFKVSEKGRQRVLAEKRKNVHAVVEGTVICPVLGSNSSMHGITYNPYRFDTFVTRGLNIPVLNSSMAMLTLEGKRPTMKARLTC